VKIVKNVRILCATVALLAACAAPAMADDRFNQGTFTLNVSQDERDFNPFVGVGYMVANNLELGANFGYSKFDTDYPGGFSTTSKAMEYDLTASFHIPTGGSAVPFVGAAVMVLDQSDSDPVTGFDFSGTGYSIGGGIDFLVTQHGSIGVRLAYASVTWDDNINNVSADTSGTGIRLGYTLYFR